MTDSKRLRDAIREKGLRYGYVAENLGITAYGFARKIDNKAEFRASEIAKLSKILGLTRSERDEIFFAFNVD